MPSGKQIGVRLGRFGFDPQTGELWPLGGEGERVVLPRQPFQILNMLLESHQKLVTREDIRQNLWPNHTTVDFGHSINVAIRLLRRAFGDSAESPRYIETLARRGYRLIVSPEPIDVPEAEEAQITAPTVSALRETENVATHQAPTSRNGRITASVTPEMEANRTGTALFWLLAVTAVLAAAVLLWRVHLRAKSSFILAPSDTIVLAVTNNTSDPVFNDAIYISLLTAIEQTPYLNVLAVNRVNEAIQKLGVSMDPTRISPQLAYRVCSGTGSRLVLHTFISQAGNGFHIDQDAIDCKTNKAVAHTTVQATSRRNVIASLGIATVRLRRALGEPKASVARFDAPLEVATSSSPDALQMLTEGYRHSLLADFTKAVSYYQRAIQMDPDLGMAYVALAGAEDSAGHEAEAAKASIAGYGLRDRLTAPLRLNAEDIYFQFGTGELEKRCSVLTQFVQTFPNDHTAHNNLSECLQLLGRFDLSLAEAREGLRLLDSSISYDRVLAAAMLSGRDDEAKAAYDASLAHHLDSALLRQDRLRLAFLQHDSASMDQQWAWAAAHPEWDAEFLFEQAQIANYFGRQQESLRLSKQASNSAVNAGDLESASFYEAHNALEQAEAGDVAEALRIATDSSKRVRNRYTGLVLAMAFARAGNIERSRSIEGSIRREWPKDTLIQNFCLPSIDAAIELRERKPRGALESLQASLDYEFADVPSFGNLYPAYLRGLAYMEVEQPQLAIVEFQKVLDHPALVGFSTLGPLSRLQIARAYAVSPGESSLALGSYRAFLNTWRSADHDIVVYRAAKAEVTKLGVKQK